MTTEMKTEEIKDAAGTVFDPQIHQIRHGAPLLRKKDGCFVLKKGVKTRLGLCENVPFRAESHVPGSVPAVQTPPQTVQTQAAESFVDAILNAGESKPTVPAPEVAEVSPGESFVPEDLTFPEETPGGDECFFTANDAHARAQDPAPKMSPQAANISAFSIVEITEQTCAVLLGEEMQMQPDEKKRLVSAWENYLATTEGVEIPPWAAALGLTALYFGSRLMLHAVQERLINIWRNLNGQPPIKRAVPAE